MPANFSVPHGLPAVTARTTLGI
ncbi:MAG: hypothetical protein QOH59_1414, partial [Gemmatimonadales bacterium]|nr:hypothetical protein [Gemmatimonadales bacterium]